MTSGNYCDLASSISLSHKDILTLETKKQILIHDQTYEKMCK